MARIRVPKRTTVSAIVLSVIVAGPVGLAIAHPGFPTTDVDLFARNVWVTNGPLSLAGQVNLQIRELNASLAISEDLDVLQQGDSIFVHDRANDTVGQVDTAVQRIPAQVELAPGAALSFGGSILAATDPVRGQVWVLDVAGELSGTLDSSNAREFGAGTQAITSADGTVYVVSASESAAYRITGPGAQPEKLFDVELADFSLTTVGQRLAILNRDGERNELIVQAGTTRELPTGPMRLQQPGPDSLDVVLASGTGVILAPINGGDLREIAAEVSAPSSFPDQFAAPVVVDNGDDRCLYAAWSNSARNLIACGNDYSEVSSGALESVSNGDELIFRVNRSSVVLNNVSTGTIWLVTEDMTVILAEDWLEVSPPLEDDEAPESDDTTTQPTFDEVLKDRPEQNTPPEPKNDDFGIRSDRTTVLSVLDNDLDPDGDVLTILSVTGLPEDFATLDLIDQGRSLQITPSDTASGSRTFAYTVTDGRPGGTAQAVVTVTVVPSSENRAPELLRSSQLSIESSKTISYNVLTDWRDPDGDDIYLTSAVSTAGDTVRYTPDGMITFTHSAGEPGVRAVVYTVSDGIIDVGSQAQGELAIMVEPSGSLLPLTVPDFASTFTGREVTVSPLSNDVSLSNSELFLVLVEPLTTGTAWTLDPERGQLTVSATEPGVHYFVYTASAGGGKESKGLVRVDIVADPETPLPPIAVKDTAFLRPSEPLTVPVLANDVSPSGAVLGIQSVSVPTAASQRGLSVEILGSTFLRVTSQGAITEPVTVGYTISDGRTSSTSNVTVVPIPELTRHQAPIARDDRATIRVGDFTSVPVLLNDFHPDGAQMRLNSELVQGFASGDGVAFVDGDRVRIQAPSEPGDHILVYRADDAFNEYATARILLTVTELDEELNRPPTPQPVTARVFAGSDLTVDIPVHGADPDGDSVILLSVSGAQSGQVLASTLTSFQYRASRDGGGTEVLRYVVEDAFGARGTGEVRIGVIPPPQSALPPSAVDDAAQVRPGSTVAVRVLDNDSDPANSPLSLRPALLEVQDGITAEVQDEFVLVTGGEEEATFVVRYEIENAQGGTDDGFITVTVTEDAAPQSPIAVDHILTVADIVGMSSVNIELLVGAFNPDGAEDELEIGFIGPGVGAVENVTAGTATIVLSERRQAVAYTLTSPETGLAATAFVVVPSATSALPPYLKPEVESNPPTLAVGQTTTLQIRDLVEVPSGGPLTIVSETPESATSGLADVIQLSDVELRITPQDVHRGDSQSVSVLVTDGVTGDGAGTLITIPLVIGDPESRDVSPLFTTIALPIEADGSTTERDLRAAISHPNQRIVNGLTFTPTISGATGAVRVSVAGGTLAVSAPLGGAAPGDEVIVDLVIDSDELLTEPITGRVVITVVPSTRPLAQANDDVEPEGRSNTSYSISALGNDFNPFAAIGGELRIVGAVIEGETLGASVSNTATTVTVVTGPAKSGTISVVYTVEDATREATRQVQGRITAIVTSAPDSPTWQGAPQRTGSQSLTVQFNPPAWNGSPEDSAQPFVVRAYVAGSNTVSATRMNCYAGAPCTFTGLTNGTPYEFTVTARNGVGETVSSRSQAEAPYGVPAAPGKPSLSAGRAPAELRGTWNPVVGDATGGGTARYQWKYAGGADPTPAYNGFTGASNQLLASNVPAGTYQVVVRACNAANLCGPWSTQSDPMTVRNPPSGSVFRGAYIGVGGDGLSYYYLGLRVNNLDAGTYSVACYADGDNGGTSPYQTHTMSLPANGDVQTPCPGAAEGYAGEWFRIAVVGQFTTPNYTPWQ